MKKIILVITGVIMLLFGYVHLNTKQFNAKKASEYITSQALSKSHNCCAWYVMKAMWVGGKPVYILPAWGYEYILPSMGFEEVSRKNYEPKEGDIVVFPRINGHIFGHIAMWNGKQWVSDFKQKNFAVAKEYEKSAYKYYRHNNIIN